MLFHTPLFDETRNLSDTWDYEDKLFSFSPICQPKEMDKGRFMNGRHGQYKFGFTFWDLVAAAADHSFFFKVACVVLIFDSSCVAFQSLQGNTLACFTTFSNKNLSPRCLNRISLVSVFSERACQQPQLHVTSWIIRHYCYNEQVS